MGLIIACSDPHPPNLGGIKRLKKNSIMKKEYIQPSVEEYKIETANMIATSPSSTSEKTPSEWGAPEMTIVDDF